MNARILTHNLRAEGLRLTAGFAGGEYRCEVSRNGENVAVSNDPTLHGAVLSALYAAPMAHIVRTDADVTVPVA